MKAIDTTNFVDKETLKTYDSINGFEVIEQLLLFKGEKIASAGRAVGKKYLDDMALIHYNLKVNSTNRLYVGMILDKFYLRNSLVCDSGRIKIPDEIYNRVKEINDKYRNIKS